MKKILFAASECVPFMKTGGLADVVGALPKEFDKNEWDVRVVMPNYRGIPEEYSFLYGSRAIHSKRICGHYEVRLQWRYLLLY